MTSPDPAAPAARPILASSLLAVEQSERQGKRKRQPDGTEWPDGKMPRLGTGCKDVDEGALGGGLRYGRGGVVLLSLDTVAGGGDEVGLLSFFF